MRWSAKFMRPRPKKPKVPVRDRARKGLSLLPSMLTLANMICGFYAIIHVGAVVWNEGQPNPENSFQVAAIAILIGMVFDMLDGRVARMTNSTSDFGAQLDSLADAITFGVAPGVMVAMLHAMGRYGGGQPFWSKVAWVFGMVYACGAVIRLARFNVETTDHSEEAHLSFKGLPSPAAAGVVATLILLQHHFGNDTPLGKGLLNAMPFVALASGYLMISRFRYTHVANRFLKGRKPAEYLTGILFGAVLAFLWPEIMIAIGFCGFALSGPVLGFRDWLLEPAPPVEVESAQAKTNAPQDAPQDDAPQDDAPQDDAPQDDAQDRAPEPSAPEPGEPAQA